VSSAIFGIAGKASEGFSRYVLIATFYGDHEHHESSIDLFLRFGKNETCCGAHSLAEAYAVLTGMLGTQARG
jgi:hypothetical protein